MNFQPRTRNHNMNNEAVKQTCDDALVSRISCKSLGYIDDPFSALFTKRWTRRSPIINRGTYTRFKGIFSSIVQFLARFKNQESQIVSFGSGMDSMYFILRHQQQQQQENENTCFQFSKYFEIDFQDVSAKKTSLIAGNKTLSPHLIPPLQILSGGMELDSLHYAILGEDLCKWETHIVPKLESLGFSKKRPTIFLAECIFVYMDPSLSDKIIEWIPANMKSPTENTHCVLVMYEQVSPNDVFGETMINNLKHRGIQLPSLSKYPSIDSQIQRFSSKGWLKTECITMYDYYVKKIRDSEKSRIAKLEIFDEMEEFNLLQQHYLFLHSEI